MRPVQIPAGAPLSLPLPGGIVLVAAPLAGSGRGAALQSGGRRPTGDCSRHDRRQQWAAQLSGIYGRYGYEHPFPLGWVCQPHGEAHQEKRSSDVRINANGSKEQHGTLSESGRSLANPWVGDQLAVVGPPGGVGEDGIAFGRRQFGGEVHDGRDAVGVGRRKCRPASSRPA